LVPEVRDVTASDLRQGSTLVKPRPVVGGGTVTVQTAHFAGSLSETIVTATRAGAFADPAGPTNTGTIDHSPLGMATSAF
jgi:hypothetical protein